MTNPKHLLDAYAVSPKKSLGQNFLHDPNALEKIVHTADLSPEDTVLEIGAGTGALTRVLAETAGRVIAVEVDERLIPILQREVGGLDNVTLVHSDILEADLDALIPPDESYIVVANLPYYITSAILRMLLDRPNRPARLVLTVQEEVAERLTAKPGDMSLLSVSVQFYGKAKVITRFPPAAFWPRPDVDSAVVRIDTYGDESPVKVRDEATFFRVVRAGFSQKRKQLRNALSSGMQIGKEQADALLTAAGIDPQRRAETLRLDEWAAIAEEVLNSKF